MGTENMDVKVFEQAPYKQASDPTSRKAKLFGATILSLLAAFVLATLGVMAWAGESGLVTAEASYIIPVGGIACFYFLRCRVLRYEIRKDSVTIIRGWPFGRIVIPMSEIIAVSRPTPEASEVDFPEGWGRPPMRNPVVRMPSGRGSIVLSRGMRSYWVGARGIRLFSSVTSAQRLVAIECEDRGYLISPEHPDEFIRDIRVAI